MKTTPFVAIHPLEPEDASAITPMRAAMRAAKGVRSGRSTHARNSTR